MIQAFASASSRKCGMDPAYTRGNGENDLPPDTAKGWPDQRRDVQTPFVEAERWRRRCPADRPFLARLAWMAEGA